MRLTPKQRRLVGIAVGVPAALILWGYVGDHLLNPRQDQPGDESAAYTDGARALLGGLAPGDDLAGWRVTSVEGPRDGMIEVEVERGDQGFSIWIARSGSQEQQPPTRTRNYDLFFGRERVPPDTHVAADQVQMVLEEVVRRVARAEAKTPVPEGM